MNTLLAILKVTDARRDVILAGGLYHSFPWRHLPPTPCIKAIYVQWNQADTCSFSEQNSPLKTATGGIIQDRVQQMERWVEHYSELYTREKMVSEEAKNAIECNPVLEDLDSEPTEEDLKKSPGFTST